MTDPHSWGTMFPIFVIGFQKCGTGTLASILGSSPLVAQPAVKEPHFFLGSQEWVADHLELYLKGRVNGQATARFWTDCSTSYVHSDRALANIEHYFPHATIVLIKRDVGERAMSAYLHLRKRVPPVDRRSESAVVYPAENASSWDGLIQLERKAFDTAIAQGAVDPGFFRSQVDEGLAAGLSEADIAWPYRYYENSNYRDWISRWREPFPGCVFVLELENLQPGLDRLAGHMTSLAGESIAFDAEGFHENKTFVPRSGLERMLIRIYRHLGVSRWVRKLEMSLGIAFRSWYKGRHRPERAYGQAVTPKFLAPPK